MRESTFTVICDRCGREEQLENFSRRELETKLAQRGWWQYLLVRTGRFMSYRQASDFCPSCMIVMERVGRDADRHWVEYKDPAEVDQGPLRSQAMELVPHMADEWLEDLRNLLTKELRKRRKK